MGVTSNGSVSKGHADYSYAYQMKAHEFLRLNGANLTKSAFPKTKADKYDV